MMTIYLVTVSALFPLALAAWVWMVMRSLRRMDEAHRARMERDARRYVEGLRERARWRDAIRAAKEVQE